MKNLITLLLLLAASMLTKGQGNDTVEKLNTLSFGSEFPKDLLKTKSLVLYLVPAQPGSNIRGEWKKIANSVQKGLKKAKIDGVVHYYIDDIYSGKEAHEAFMRDFEERGLKNLVFVQFENGIYKLIVTEISENEGLIIASQKAWKTENSDLDVALDNLYKATANSGLVDENFLIIGVPEFGEMSKFISGRRSEFYDLNFSSEKLAVPIFADTSTIRQVMKTYPYEWGFVDPSVPDKDLRSKGYQYILYFVHTTGRSVKEILEYSITNSETEYISEIVEDGKARVKVINVNADVYKFYIKHIYSGNVFLGKKWDADTTWPQGLNNYLNNLRNELVRN